MKVCSQEVHMSQDAEAATSDLSDSPLIAPRDRREQIRLRVVDEGFARIEDLAQAFRVG
jgi:hypothetical protein